MPPLLADFIHARGCKLICEKSLTLPILRRQKDISIIYILASILSIPITYGCIQWVGLTGAALSFVAVHTIIFILYLMLLM